MIDEKKYEGHTEGPWEVPHEMLVSGLNHIGPLTSGQKEVNEADAQLIADAPLLLAEVEELRNALKVANKWIARLERFQTMVGDYHLTAFIDAWDKEETGHKTLSESEEE
tara:strand:+ start:435 stop:764 length:330 start_codon:yes stop_codon:yes gene_type:complete